MKRETVYVVMFALAFAGTIVTVHGFVVRDASKFHHDSVGKRDTSLGCGVTELANGDITKGLYKFVLPMYTFTCNEGYHLEGSPSLICIGGQLHGHMPVCIETASSFVNNDCPVTLSASEECDLVCGGGDYCKIKPENLVRCCRMTRIVSTTFAGKVNRCSESCYLPPKQPLPKPNAPPKPQTTTKPETPSPKPETTTKPETSSPKPQKTTKPETSSPKPQTTTKPETSSPKPQTTTKPETPSPKPQTTTKPETPSPKPETTTKPETSSPKPQTTTKQDGEGKQTEAPPVSTTDKPEATPTKPTDCDVTAPSNGDVEKQVDGNLVRYVYTCKSGYHLNGSPSLTCISGKLDRNPPVCEVTDQSFTNEENKCTVTLSASEVCTASCAGDEYCRIKAGNVRCCRLQRIKSTSFAGKVDRCSESCVLPIPPKPACVDDYRSCPSFFGNGRYCNWRSRSRYAKYCKATCNLC